MKFDLTFFVRGTTSVMALSIISLAQAAVTLDRTRIVFDGDQPSINVTIRNDNPEMPYLAQSWLEDASGQKLSTGPIIATPPIQRMEPQKMSIVRLSTAPGASQLPQDRESLFYYNLREIPPKSEETGVLQIALQSRVKLFYRPAALVEQSKKNWENQVTLTTVPGGYQIDNPTGFHLTVIGFGNTKKQSEESHFDSVMIAPQSTQKIESIHVSTPYLTYINDFGGKPSLAFHCRAEKCNVVE